MGQRQHATDMRVMASTGERGAVHRCRTPSARYSKAADCVMNSIRRTCTAVAGNTGSPFNAHVAQIETCRQSARFLRCRTENRRSGIGYKSRNTDVFFDCPEFSLPRSIPGRDGRNQVGRRRNPSALNGAGERRSWRLCRSNKNPPRYRWVARKYVLASAVDDVSLPPDLALIFKLQETNTT